VRHAGKRACGGPGSADSRRVSAVKDSGTARAPGDATTDPKDLDSARAVPPNSLRGIEVLKGAHIPDSIQRVCPSRLRGIIYLRTRP
jgi:hypothetical protein